jgi:type VI secretion system Hcp family effector
MGWSQIFLKISIDGLGTDGIGESEVAGYEGQIILADFDWSMKGHDVIKGTGASRTVTRRVNSETVSVTKRFDASSVTLMTAMRERKRVKSAAITVAHGFASGKADGGLRNAFILELLDGYIEEIDLDLVSDGKAMVLQEELTIRYSKLNIKVFEVDANGRYTPKCSTFQCDVQSQTLT